MIKILVFNLFQIVPLNWAHSRFTSICIRPLCKITSWTATTPSFSNHDYEFTPFLLWPSFPFDPTYAPVTKYCVFQQYVSFRNPRTPVCEKQHPAFPQKTCFPILDGQTSCLKSCRSEFGLICDKKLSLISRLEFFFFLSFFLNK